MDRVLALQGLSPMGYDDLEFNSGGSNICSVQSSGQGASSCSIACGDFAEMAW